MATVVAYSKVFLNRYIFWNGFIHTLTTINLLIDYRLIYFKDRRVNMVPMGAK